MTEPFDYDGLTAHIRAIRTHDDAYNALRERIEAAFVPIEHHTAVITDHDELLQHEIARAEAAEAAFVPVERHARELFDATAHGELKTLEALARAEAAEAENAKLREALAVAVAEMSRARGRLEIIAGCNEDRRIAAALGGACDFARRCFRGEHDK